MNIYLLDNESHPLDGALDKALQQMEFNVEHLLLPDSHEDIVPLMRSKKGGIVFLPAIWVDLLCVKALQEIQTLSQPLETIICGPEPNSSDLIVAFNEGLSSYLQAPLDDDVLKCVLSRTTARYKEKLQQEQKERSVEDCGSDGFPVMSSQERVLRDRLLAGAFLESLHQQGPLFENTIRVLLVSSSSAQQKRLEAFLKKANIVVKGVGSIEEAAKAAQAEQYAAIVSGSVLPDGDAATLANRLRSSIASEFPRLVVWTSSPEKAMELLRPENHIDDVVLKQGPDASMDSILLSIIMGVYQTKVA